MAKAPRKTTRRRRKSPTSTPPPQADTPRRILTAALEAAERDGWEGVRLEAVAAAARVTLAQLRRHYRDRDALADAWFAHALDAMLAPTERSVADLPARERLYILILRWLDAMAPHRRLTAEMARAKLYAAHPHHWGPAIANVSRTVQWLRDAAGLGALGRRRQVEEIGLTLLLLATFVVWTRDDTPEQSRTRLFLERRLLQADRAMARLFPAPATSGLGKRRQRL